MNLRRVSLLVFVLILVIIGSFYVWRVIREPDTVELEYTVIVDNLSVPWEFTFTGEGEIFLTERSGDILYIVDGVGSVIHHIDAYQDGEGGLLGITLDPNYSENHYLYVYYTYRDDEVWNRVSRFTYSDEKLVDEIVIIDKIPGGRIHDGGRIKFGPDGLLYVCTGETGNGDLAQDIDSLAGKILRVDSLGGVPVSNPISGSPIYSIGHRNPQGLAWSPVSGDLYSTEHGPSGEGFAFAHDEINRIVASGNYGWPTVVGTSDNSEFINPVYNTGDETWAPSGACFYDGDGAWGGWLFVACLRGNGIRVIELGGGDVGEIESIFSDAGRVRTVVQGPDGYMYFCTSNMDGRGTRRVGGDFLAKFTPPD